MTTLCLYSVAQEETGLTAREATETDGKTHEGEFPYDVNYVDNLLRRIFILVFQDPSCNVPENPDWARRFLDEKKRTGGIHLNGSSQVAEEYLMMKGDASDIDRISPSLRKPLAMRVAGTNLVNYPEPPLLNLNSPIIVPSVTNNGPQGRYVFEILYQYWKKLEIEYQDGDRNRPFRDPSKIPAELLTLVVWFDGEGKPVCNVDLSKYGLAMPELDVKPPRPSGTPPREGNLTRTNSPPAEGWLAEQDGVVPPPTRTWLYLVIALLALLGGAAVWRNAKRRIG